MPRDVDPDLAAALASGFCVPFFAAQIAFVSQTFNLWSGAWPLTYAGQTWQGTGDLGKISSIVEDSSVEAKGVTVTLSGINTAILQECLDDVQLGAPATIYLGALDPVTAQPIGTTPLIMFAGLVDKPTVTYGPAGKCSITLSIESHLIRLASGSQRHYTQADQRRRFPTDTMFARVESTSDLALRWGT